MGEKAQRLNEIIQAMFKLLPGQRVGAMLDYATVAIPELLEEVRSSCQPFWEQRGQTVEIDAHSAARYVQADREKLHDVLENLLINAIKFTPDGGTIRMSARMEIGGYVALSVCDQGPGVPPGERPHIFEPFYAGGEVYQHSTGDAGYQKRGMGLGLAVVRHFVQLHGGTVNVQSSGEGATFTVIIPVDAPGRKGRPEAPE